MARARGLALDIPTLTGKAEQGRHEGLMSADQHINLLQPGYLVLAGEVISAVFAVGIEVHEQLCGRPQGVQHGVSLGKPRLLLEKGFDLIQTD